MAPSRPKSMRFSLGIKPSSKLDGILLLAPTTPATIQALRLRVVPPEAQ